MRCEACGLSHPTCPRCDAEWPTKLYDELHQLQVSVKLFHELFDSRIKIADRNAEHGLPEDLDYCKGARDALRWL